MIIDSLFSVTDDLLWNNLFSLFLELSILSHELPKLEIRGTMSLNSASGSNMDILEVQIHKHTIQHKYIRLNLL